MLRIILLGNIKIHHQDEIGNIAIEDVKIIQSVRNLLAYLLLFRQRTYQRETLSGLFWGGYSDARARHCLNTAVWRLRRILEPKGIDRGAYLLTTPNGEIGINSGSNLWLDFANFEETLNSITSKPIQVLSGKDVRRMEWALELYKGDLLEGLYENWAILERERFRLLYLKGLNYLMLYYKLHQDYENSLLQGQRILNLDPLSEETHREMILTYLESGQRVLAIRQYETCREVLRTEMGIEPMRATQDLYRQTIADLPMVAPNGTPSLQETLKQLSSSIIRLEEAHQNMQKSIHIIEDFMRQIKV